MCRPQVIRYPPHLSDLSPVGQPQCDSSLHSSSSHSRLNPSEQLLQFGQPVSGSVISKGLGAVSKSISRLTTPQLLHFQRGITGMSSGLAECCSFSNSISFARQAAHNRVRVQFMQPAHDSAEPSNGPKNPIAKCVLGLVVLVSIMIWSAYHEGPSGQSFGVMGFILFWLKELLLLGFVAIVLLIGGIRALRRGVQQRAGNDHALLLCTEF
jgi:hypothetical protein